MRHKTLIFVALIIVAFVAASLINSYWATIPYAHYKTGQEIIGFPYPSTSMTVNGFSTTPDITFPNSSTDIFVNVTIHRLENDLKQSQFPMVPNKFLALSFGTAKGHGEASAWNGFNDSFGIFTPDNELNSLDTNQSGSIRFTLGNGNYTYFQLVCRSESQQKALFIVDLQSQK